MRLLALTHRYYAVLAQVSLGYPPLKGRLVTCYSPVRHFTHGLLHFLVRLACVRHAASVDSEPGSNSRLILVCHVFRTEVRTAQRLRSLERSGGYKLVRMTQPNIRVISRLARSTMLSKILTASALAGSFGSRTQEGKATSMCPRTWCAVCTGRALSASLQCFARLTQSIERCVVLSSPLSLSRLRSALLQIPASKPVRACGEAELRSGRASNARSEQSRNQTA